MIIKTNDVGDILDFFIGNDTPTCEGTDVDETGINVSDFIVNYSLYIYDESGLHRDPEKVAAHEAEQAAQAAAAQQESTEIDAQKQINARLMSEIAKLKVGMGDAG